MPGRRVGCQAQQFPCSDEGTPYANVTLFAMDFTQSITPKPLGCLFRRAIYRAPLPIIIHTEDGEVILVNKEWISRSGYTRKDIPISADWFKMTLEMARTVLEQGDAATQVTKKARRGGEYTIVTNTGTKLLWDLHAASIGSLPDGRRLFMTMAQDITVHRHAEMQFHESLQEKETLLKEVHHRVKNNMQIILSLLNLQSRCASNSETENFLKESKGRIRSMALIHNMLSRSSSLTSIDFKEYTRKLVGEIIHSSCNPTHNISLKINIDNILFDIKTAILCGLIIHELVSNSLKHGFVDNRKGNIDITLCRDEGEMYTLIVGDNGVGFPAACNQAPKDSLGFKLVRMLTQQLHGTIKQMEAPGTTFIITFRYINRTELPSSNTV